MQNCTGCGRDTDSATGMCHHCMPHATTRSQHSGKSRGRKQLEAKRQWLEAGEVPRFDPIDPQADKDKEWDEYDFD